MNILKLFILNMILLYFLRYNIKFGIILLCITIVYLLLLNSDNIEGNNIEDAKRELKYLDMLNINRLLNQLTNVFEHSEEDCYGDYTNYGACDKKCGKSYKYKTYRIKRPGGILGAKCEQEDGFREKNECDKDDGIYPCKVGDKCNMGEDCDSGNCDPKTHTCVTVKVCSDENLDLCDPLKCEDLNNQYDITGKHYVYDLGDKICKLKPKEIDKNNKNNDEKKQKINLPANLKCPEWMEQDGEQSTGTSKVCKMINNDTVYLKDDELKTRKSKYGIDAVLDPGLYCKEGYKFYPLVENGDVHSQDDNEEVGVKTPIENVSPNEIRRGCKVLINGAQNASTTYVSKQKDGDQYGSSDPSWPCETGYWPPLQFFKDNINLKQVDIGHKIPINDMCKRCDNGYVYDSTKNVCNSQDDCTKNNQYTLMSEGAYIETPIYTYDEIGKNTGCTDIGGGTPYNKTSCTIWASTFKCPAGTHLEKGDGGDGEASHKTCCRPCPLGTYNDKVNTSASCLNAGPGHYVDQTGATEQTPCSSVSSRFVPYTTIKKKQICEGCVISGDDTEDTVSWTDMNPTQLRRTSCGPCMPPNNYYVPADDEGGTPTCKPCPTGLKVTTASADFAHCKNCAHAVRGKRQGQYCSTCTLDSCNKWLDCEGPLIDGNIKCNACKDNICTAYECDQGYINAPSNSLGRLGGNTVENYCGSIDDYLKENIIDCFDALAVESREATDTKPSKAPQWVANLLETSEGSLKTSGRLEKINKYKTMKDTILDASSKMARVGAHKKHTNYFKGVVEWCSDSHIPQKNIDSYRTKMDVTRSSNPLYMHVQRLFNDNLGMAKVDPGVTVDLTDRSPPASYPTVRSTWNTTEDGSV